MILGWAKYMDSREASLLSTTSFQTMHSALADHHLHLTGEFLKSFKSHLKTITELPKPFMKEKSSLATVVPTSNRLNIRLNSEILFLH